ncbi:MAG: type II toxin-antitoxin system RelE/ParE family toxin [Thermoanaerobaculia bacterium]
MRWTALAIDRAEEEAAFIATDKPDAALRWLDGLFDAVDDLASFPDSGRIVPEIGLPNFRELIYRRAHRVVYRRDASIVWILTVRRCKRPLDVGEVLP